MGQGSLSGYVTGFGLSLVLTLAAYGAVVSQALSGGLLLAAIIITAIIQLMVQLIFFLHLGRESKPRWNGIVFLFMLLVLLILVVGTLWIMYNLNYNMTETMTPEETKQHIEHKEGISR